MPIIAHLAVILCISISSTAYGAELKGYVVSVSDGDTVTVVDAHKVEYRVRLSGIDAPEKSQPYGNASRQKLADVIFHKNVQVTYSKSDRYGRVLGKIELNGRDINLSQIESGLAWHYKFYEKDQPQQDRIIYSDAENHARIQRIGLWLEPNPVEPWLWRKMSLRK